MAEKHTSGPWDAARAYGEDGRWHGSYSVAGGPDRMIVATVWGDDRPVADPRPAEANARLIAAAPDLLDACQEAIRAINSHTTEPIPVGAYNRVARMLGDAIRKATGEADPCARS